MVKDLLNGLVCLAAAVLLQGGAAANMLQNGDFTRGLEGWTNVESGQKVAAESPGDRPGALRVEVVKENGTQLGEIRQSIPVQPNRKYRLSADIKSSRPGMALLMIKPRAGGQELSRIETQPSGEQWTAVRKEFTSGDATEVQVLCRYSQRAEAVGSICWFTNVRLETLDAPAPIARPVASSSTDQYVAAQAVGDGSGRDWANARSATGGGLQVAIDTAGPGSTVFVGSGIYMDQALQVSTGGSGPAALKTIAGVDTGSGRPVFRSGFDKSSPANTGTVLFTVASGVSHVVIRDLLVEGHRMAVNTRGNHLNLLIDNVDVTASRDAFWLEGGAIAGQPDSGSRDLVLKNCSIRNFTKRGVRIVGGNSNVQIINCHADAGGKEWATEPFAMGFGVLGGKDGVLDRQIVFTDCSASNCYNDGGPVYWNADGFCAERAVTEITFTRCLAYGNTDGGWDVKSSRARWIDCIGIANKRNFRMWSVPGPDGAVLENCLSAFATDYGQMGHEAGFWSLAGGDVTLIRCTSWQDTLGLSVEGKGEVPPTALKVERCLVGPVAGAATRLADGVDLQNSASIIGAATVTLRKPSPDWRGGDDSFDSLSHPDIGYKHAPSR